jgi:hypothetical protein
MRRLPERAPSLLLSRRPQSNAIKRVRNTGLGATLASTASTARVLRDRGSTLSPEARVAPIAPNKVRRSRGPGEASQSLSAGGMSLETVMSLLALLVRFE